MLANDRHTVNGSVTSAVFSGEGVAVEAGRISHALCLVEKVFPLVVWKAAVVPNRYGHLLFDDQRTGCCHSTLLAVGLLTR